MDRPTLWRMAWSFAAEIIEWRGPAPYFYLPMPIDDSDELKFEARGLEYWGQVGVRVRIGDTEFTTAVFPKDGRYLVPLRADVRRTEGLEVGHPVAATVELNRDRGYRPDRSR